METQWLFKAYRLIARQVDACGEGIRRHLAISLVVAVAVLLNTSTAIAQQNRDIARIVPIITALLLEEPEPLVRPEGDSIELTLGQTSGTTLRASADTPVFLEFERQNQGVEICFDLTTNSRSITSSNIIVEVNGRRQFAAIGNDNCFVISLGLQRAENFVSLRIENSNAGVRLRRIELSQSNPTDALGLPTSTRGSWDDRAVRKVLKIFAYGGQATDQQIQMWADMPANDAIQEMLNFDQHNTKLSPLTPADAALGYDEISNIQGSGTLSGFINYISDDASTVPLSQIDRDVFLLSERGFGISETFQRFMVMRGLNPFRQRIGFWETNYHMAVNLNTSLQDQQMVAYYDEVMNAHAQGLPYYEVIGVAAKSAAVAMQYGHRFNSWDEDDQECACNDDFAREIHQLFFGIFGLANPDAHENVTIRQTSRLLTGMPVERDGSVFDTFVTYDTPEADGRRDPQHHEGPLQILGQTITGRTAEEKLDNLMPISIQHPESLENLPIMIVEVLADNNLSQLDKTRLRAAWAALGRERNFLDYIHAYATSRVFHSRQQVKYLTTFDRLFYTANKFNVSQVEAIYSRRGNSQLRGGVGREFFSTLRTDRAGGVFEPLNNVFGGQSAIEASDSTLAFEGNFNHSATDRNIDYRARYDIRCEDCDNGNEWIKDWSQAIPPEANGGYSAGHIARWMWRHFVGSMDNYTDVEHAHLVAILGAESVEDTVENLNSFSANGDDRNRFWDLNYLLCIRADLVERGEPASRLVDLMGDPALDNRPWVDRCRVTTSTPYSRAERDAFNLVITSEVIRNTPHIQRLVDQLAASQVRLQTQAGSPSPAGGQYTQAEARFIRYRANERVQAAAVFMMATPFVFGEGQR